MVGVEPTTSTFSMLRSPSELHTRFIDASGLEPETPHFKGACSNQLSYTSFLNRCSRTRTCNHRIKSPLLYRLSYTPDCMGTAGFEPATARLKTLRSSTELRSLIVTGAGFEPASPGSVLRAPRCPTSLRRPHDWSACFYRSLPLYFLISDAAGFLSLRLHLRPMQSGSEDLAISRAASFYPLDLGCRCKADGCSHSLPGGAPRFTAPIPAKPIQRTGRADKETERKRRDLNPRLVL